MVQLVDGQRTPPASGNYVTSRVLPGETPTILQRLGELARDRRFLLYAAAVVVSIFTIRYLYYTHTTPQVDEPATLLAIVMTSQRGIPLFPSDVLYLQGLSITYLSVPFAFIFQNLELLRTLEFINLIGSMLLPIMGFLLVLKVTESTTAGLLAGLLIGLDPGLILWSAYIRPYTLLTVLTMAIVYLFVHMLLHGPQSRFLGLPAPWLMVGLVWLATATHMVVWLVCPFIGLCACYAWGKTLLKENRILLVCGAVSLIAPALFVIGNSFVGTGSRTDTSEGGVGFVGDHVLNLGGFDQPRLSLRVWQDSFTISHFTILVGYFVVIIIGLLLGQILDSTRSEDARLRRVVFPLAVLYFGPILTTTLMSAEKLTTRYIIHVMALGYILVVIGLWRLLRIESMDIAPRWIGARALFVGLLALPILAHVVEGSVKRVGEEAGGQDYFSALEFVEDNMSPDDMILVALPAYAYFAFPEDVVDNQVIFLAGPAGGERANNYVKHDHHSGGPVDYWLGVPAIASTEQLCTFLATHRPVVWIVVDAQRLDSNRAYWGPFSEVIRATSPIVANGRGNVLVRKAIPITEWGPRTRAECPNIIFSGDPTLY